MKVLALLGPTVVLVLLLGVAGHGAADCEAVGDVRFVCGQSGPEDLISVPDSPWVLVSSFPQGSGGLRLIDTRDLTTTVLLPTASPRERLDRSRYGACPGPIVSVEKEDFATHGLHLAAGPNSIHTVFAVHHGLRESVEVFELDAGAEPPEVTWVGCAVAPDELKLNSVVSLPDGSFAATSFRCRDCPIEPVMAGEISGAIWEWHPDSEWQMVPGSETSGPNGVEISPDGRWYYIGAWGTQSFIRLSRGQTPVERAEVAAEFRIDNVRMAPDGWVFATGQGSKGSPTRTSNVARVDPKTMRLEEIFRRPDDDVFSTASTALQVGDEIWVGSLGDKIARFQIAQP